MSLYDELAQILHTQRDQGRLLRQIACTQRDQGAVIQWVADYLLSQGNGSDAQLEALTASLKKSHDALDAAVKAVTDPPNP